MFDDYKFSIDLKEVLNKEYNFNYTGDQIKLITKPFIEFEGNGVDAYIWIIYKNKRYLFKPLNQRKNNNLYFNIDETKYNIWGELLSKEIAKKLGIPCAKYRYATLGELKGVITEDLLTKDEILLLGSNVFQLFFNKYKYDNKSSNIFKHLDNISEKELFSKINNIDDIKIILSKLNISDKEAEDIINGLIKVSLFDIITLQKDRHPNNWGIIKSNNNFRLSPLFDNNTCLGLNYPRMQDRINLMRNEMQSINWNDESINHINSLLYHDEPQLKFSSSNTDSLNTLSYFINNYDTTKFNYIFNLIDNNTIDEVISNVEKENNITMDNNLYLYIKTIWEYNIDKIKSLVLSNSKEDDSNGIQRQHKSRI